MKAALLSSWTLFFGIALFMVGNGLQGVLLGIKAEQLSFGVSVTGFVMGGFYFGYVIGSFFIPTIVSRVGHVRVFGAMAGLASSSILIHAIVEISVVWFFMRVITGFAYVGLYIVAESWINDKATNDTRGALLSFYMIAQMLGLICGQLMLVLDDGASYHLFLWASILVSLAVIPILMTAAKVPDFQEPERASFKHVYKTSPLAVSGMAFIGMTSAMIFGMGAVFASKLGMTINEISIFMASFVVGTLILQYPIGKLSDIIDRRTVILFAHILSVLSALGAWIIGDRSFGLLILAALIHGGGSTPLYSLYIAHANDFLTSKQVVSSSSKLIMISGIGSMVGAPVMGYMIFLFGAMAFFAILTIAHAMMGIFVVVRMRARPALPTEEQGTFVVMPRGTASATPLLPEAEWEEDNAA